MRSVLEATRSFVATDGLSPAASTRPHVAGLVLAGGQSRRMGTDKSALVVDGLSMLDRATRALRDAGITTLAVPGSAELPDPTGSNDGSDPLGPLAGIVSGLSLIHI